MPIEPSQARCAVCGDTSPHVERTKYCQARLRFRAAAAMQRLARVLGIELLPTDDECVGLERLAYQAERLTGYLQACGRNHREEIPDERSPEDWKNHAE